jgi:hypothetical protein
MGRWRDPLAAPAHRPAGPLAAAVAAAVVAIGTGPIASLSVAEGTDGVTGARITIEVMPRSGVTRVRAASRNVESNSRYGPYAVTRQGRSIPVQEFSGWTRTVGGDVPVPASDLVSFHVVRETPDLS